MLAPFKFGNVFLSFSRDQIQEDYVRSAKRVHTHLYDFVEMATPETACCYIISRNQYKPYSIVAMAL